MTQLIRTRGDSLTWQNSSDASLGGLGNALDLQTHCMHKSVLPNARLSFQTFLATNERKRSAACRGILASAYATRPNFLPIARLQQLTLNTKGQSLEESDSFHFQGMYPLLSPISPFFNTHLVSFASSVKNPFPKIQEGLNHDAVSVSSFNTIPGDNPTRQDSIQEIDRQYHSAVKINHQDSLKPSMETPNASQKKTGVAKASDKELGLKGWDSHWVNDIHELSKGTRKDLLATRKRSSSWPVDSQLAKKKFVQKHQGDKTSQGYENREIDVAKILVSDIPVAVVGLAASKDCGQATKVNSERESGQQSCNSGLALSKDRVQATVGDSEKESRQESCDSAGDVDSDSTWHSEQENRVDKPHEPALVVFSCQQCGVPFKSMVDLLAHTTSHTKNFAFACNVCSQVFRSTSGLQKHVEFHADDEHRHHCSFCFQLLANRSDVEKHIIAAHMSRRPHKCTYCPKAFRDPGSLQKHIRVHTGEKPYQCTECDKSFAEYSSLRKHHRVHTGEQPYRCKFCPKAFSISGNLQRHILIHTGERPYRCADCNKSFNNPSHLRRHMKNLHSKLESQK